VDFVRFSNPSAHVSSLQKVLYVQFSSFMARVFPSPKDVLPAQSSIFGNLGFPGLFHLNFNLYKT